MKSLYIWFVAILLLFHLEFESFAAAQTTGELEMKVKTVVIDPNAQSPVVILEAVASKEFLPIWIDVPEARAIAREIEQIKTERPLTHDLVRNILNDLGTKVKRVTITDLLNHTYFAIISLTMKDREAKIDSRPSDAIAIALRMKAPIYVSRRVIEKSRTTTTSLPGASETPRRLGIQVQELSVELAKLMDSQFTRGLIVTDVIDGSPAMKADIHRGDIITKLNDQSVHNAAALDLVLKTMTTPGSVKIDLMKNGKPMTIRIDLP